MTKAMRRREGRTYPTPIYITPRVRTLLVLAVIAALVAILWLVPAVFTILVGGAALALILSFPVRLLEKVMRRRWALLVTLLGLVAAIAIALGIVIPILIDQLSALVASAPDIAKETQGLLQQVLRALREHGLLKGSPQEIISGLNQGVIDKAQGAARAVLGGLVGFVSSTISGIFEVFGMLFVGVYMLIDIRRFKAAYVKVVPLKYRRDALELWDSLGFSLSRYLTGVLVSLVEQGLLATIALWILGVPYAVVLGVWTAATAILPLIGSFLGAIPAVVLAFFVSPLTAVLTIVAYVVINQFDSNVVVPKVQGEALKVHPIIIFLAIVAGGSLGGLLGALLALPTVAVIRVMFDFLRERLRVAEVAA